jgi:hypothetical protein
VSAVFDRITVDDGDGPRDLTLEEFLKLPLFQRVQLILQNRLTFSLDGLPVGTREALKELRILLAEPTKR